MSTYTSAHDEAPDEPLREEAALQSEARRLSEDLELESMLSAIGRPTRVGSAALGLMARRDLDYTVSCERLDPATFTAVVDMGARLAAHQRVREVRFRDDTGHWNTDPMYPDGLYLGVECRSPEGHDWNLDLWFVDEPDRQPDLAHLRTLAPRLTPETRAAILRLKRAWVRRPEYGVSVRGVDVYRAVLDDGVRTEEEFDRWRRRQERDGTADG